MDQPILALRNITKTFGPKVANENISLTIYPGEVHALVGENGAGKTTLMNMVSGNLQPDSGEIFFDGRSVVMSDPRKADALGIGMVHQHFKLVPSLTVTANIFLGKETVRAGTLDAEPMRARVRELSERFGLPVNPDDVVRELSVGERQRVEVIKALSHDTRLLILDEPTAVLTPAETDELFIVIRQLAKQGCAILFISHKLGEVLAIADTVSVIRDGKVVGTRPAEGLSQTDIAAMMVGREVLLRIRHRPATPGDEILSVRDVCAVDKRGALAVRNLSLHVRRGEIVGIAGVEGNGQSELAAAIAGMYKAPRGAITMAGRDVTRASVAARRDLGLAYIPEDRHHEGSGPRLTVAENIAATHMRPPIVTKGWLSVRRMRELASSLIAKFDIRGAGPDTVISTLSGGNMQKVIIAREFSNDPALLMVSQPTRGVDVGAMEFVHNSIVAARDAGAGVLLFSADLNEVMSLSDRLLVMFRGEIVAEFTQANMSEVAVGLAMAGVAPTPDALAEAEARHRRVQEELAAVSSTGDAEMAKVADDEAVAAPLTDAEAARVAATALPRASGFFAEFAKNAFTSALQPLLAIGAALVLGAIVILAIGKNPLTAYSALFLSGWSSPFGIASIIAAFVPLAILAVGTIVSFRAGFFNIGAEGQMFLGAFFGAFAGFTFPDLPAPVLIPLVLLFGTVAGGLWGLLPGALLARWRVDIIVTTLLLTDIAKLLTQYFVSGPFQDPSAGIAGTRHVAPQARLTMFSSTYGLGADLLLALAAAVLIAVIFDRTPWGARVRQLGEMNDFAEYTGVSASRMSMQVMMVSGAVAGFTGALFVLGPNGGRFLQQFSPGFGFMAMTVALLARLNPWLALPAALFYATMLGGSTGLQTAGVPFPLVGILQGLIIIMITATFTWNWWRRRVRRPDLTQPTTATTEGASL
ncbi:ATP-binding cassette domain-containing protein [Tessaracoccus sp. G1721]